ncbi:MAG: hypothetical protein A3J69_00075 [Candidatus Levybacteria bacterium RIFCSPHIGHO2_02_FULL_42_12]|nr:MAG: hypothetical protein A3J69_00075 [Candidatus Levybacteria bacterium RIFCSPHIGHO2_02_FULL_42_12]
MRKLIVLLTVFVALLFGWSTFTTYVPSLSSLSKTPTIPKSKENVRIVNEESVVIDIVEKVSPSVVTVGIEQKLSDIDPFDPFGVFGLPRAVKQEQDIGSGFVVSTDGLIVTNKHVTDGNEKYKVITQDGKKYDVARIYRDPSNDIAILKISATGLKMVEMGDSSKVKVGQLVVAVGTPLGEFRGSVTKGIISGLGRGITAGSSFEGYVERLDGVIQTDAAINPGNSGGPLVNSSGQVIGINTAVASGAENIGFAIPINVVKEALDNFNKTGGFSRPYIGVVYQMVGRETAIRIGIPEGAYVREVVDTSPAYKAGIAKGDIITKINGEKVQDTDGGLASVVAKKKVGDEVTVTLWREDSSDSKGKTLELKVKLESSPQE